ncbi:hypothetical protein [Halalkalicoccus sp. NIPERK01]|uniref:hypothetical protein n=1 Tax=Halalkalicoccus sp. NIPERK01 TaxID=3053469 RepID=UPI00256F59B6|nr:hypothetical protein [Halalkalicoccus sp. NIPERK01]MDL5363903.1 hypothetical protein [Halalkalicoccus sp. NIPERK01]
MPRPNHDIPGLLLGGVRDYAAENDMSRDEAHAELLRIGLKEVGILPALECDDKEEDEE